MGRALDNALLNLGLKNEFSESADKLGFNLEDLIGSFAFDNCLITCVYVHFNS